MKKLFVTLTAVIGLGGAGLSMTMTDVEAACGVRGPVTTTEGARASCTCNSASGYAQYRSATSTLPGDSSGLINVGNNSSNDLLVYVRCYNDVNRFIDRNGAWGPQYAYVSCTAAYPYTTRTACTIRA